MKKQLIAGIACSVLTFAAHAQSEPRVALVIGNATYKSNPLKNPANDAKDFSNNLRKYGFTVIEKTNLTTKQIGATLREFRSKLTPGSVAVVFYAGHGLQIKGENYLPAIDADIQGEEDVPNQSLSTKQIMDVLADAKTRMNLVFLDACRDNPYTRGFRSSSKGLSKENAPSGTLISFATRPGSVAADGDGRNGLYTGILLQQMKQADQPIEQVLKKVVSGVKTTSKGQQEPWMEGSIEGDFCFQKCASNQPSIIQSNSVNNDGLFWESIKDSKNPKEFSEYLTQFPNGVFVLLAKTKLEMLSRSSPEDNYRRGLELSKYNNYEKNEVEAVRLFRAAADEGHAGAQASLGTMYRFGLGGLLKDEVQAVKLYKSSSDQKNLLGIVNLGTMYLYGRGGLIKDELEALRLYRLAADQNDAGGQINLADMYLYGKGGLVKNEFEAARLYRLAADQGDAIGQRNLGNMYLNGRGVIKDEFEAVRFYRLAAEQGDAIGQRSLGNMYLNGRGGLVKDESEAERLYRLAAEKGDDFARINLPLLKRGFR